MTTASRPSRTFKKGEHAIHLCEHFIRYDDEVHAISTGGCLTTAWRNRSGDFYYIGVDEYMMPADDESVVFDNPSAPHTTINAAKFTCEGFPRPLTQADIDALHKRALDAEDHLRAEALRCQAIIDRQAEMERVSSHHRTAAWNARKEVDAVTERLRMSRRSMADNLKKHCEVSTAEIADRDATIANLRADSARLHDETVDIIKDRDQTIADLQALLARCTPPGYTLDSAKEFGVGPDSEWYWSVTVGASADDCGVGTYKEVIAAAWSHYHATALKRRED